MEHVGKITSWGDIRIDPKPDDTMENIRKNVSLLSLEKTTAGKTTAADTPPPDPSLHDLTTHPELAELFAYDIEHEVVNRVLHRQIMEGSGWTIKFFADLPELLRVLKHTITGISKHT